MIQIDTRVPLLRDLVPELAEITREPAQPWPAKHLVSIFSSPHTTHDTLQLMLADEDIQGYALINTFDLAVLRGALYTYGPVFARFEVPALIIGYRHDRGIFEYAVVTDAGFPQWVEAPYIIGNCLEMYALIKGGAETIPGFKEAMDFILSTNAGADVN